MAVILDVKTVVVVEKVCDMSHTPCRQSTLPEQSVSGTLSIYLERKWNSEVSFKVVFVDSSFI